MFAGDGRGIPRWGGYLEAADVPSTMIVGVHGLADETLRLPTERTAVFGASAGGELALALGLRHPEVYGAVLSGSPGGGYQPTGGMPSRIPRTYLVAGTLEPFFLDDATRWAVALRDAGAEVVMSKRVGSHGSVLWRAEFPLMVAWAFGWLQGLYYLVIVVVGFAVGLDVAERQHLSGGKLAILIGADAGFVIILGALITLQYWWTRRHGKIPLVFGADPQTRREARRALKAGGTNDARVDDLISDQRTRWRKRRPVLVVLGVLLVDGGIASA